MYSQERLRREQKAAASRESSYSGVDTPSTNRTTTATPDSWPRASLSYDDLKRQLSFTSSNANATPYNISSSRSITSASSFVPRTPPSNWSSPAGSVEANASAYILSSGSNSPSYASQPSSSQITPPQTPSTTTATPEPPATPGVLSTSLLAELKEDAIQANTPISSSFLHAQATPPPRPRLRSRRIPARSETLEPRQRPQVRARQTDPINRLTRRTVDTPSIFSTRSTPASIQSVANRSGDYPGGVGLDPRMTSFASSMSSISRGRYSPLEQRRHMRVPQQLRRTPLRDTSSVSSYQASRSNDTTEEYFPQSYSHLTSPATSVSASSVGDQDSILLPMNPTIPAPTAREELKTWMALNLSESTDDSVSQSASNVESSASLRSLNEREIKEIAARANSPVQSYTEQEIQDILAESPDTSINFADQSPANSANVSSFASPSTPLTDSKQQQLQPRRYPVRVPVLAQRSPSPEASERRESPPNYISRRPSPLSSASSAATNAYPWSEQSARSGPRSAPNNPFSTPINPYAHTSISLFASHRLYDDQVLRQIREFMFSPITNADGSVSSQDSDN